MEMGWDCPPANAAGLDWPDSSPLVVGEQYLRQAGGLLLGSAKNDSNLVLDLDHAKYSSDSFHAAQELGSTHLLTGFNNGIKQLQISIQAQLSALPVECLKPPELDITKE